MENNICFVKRRNALLAKMQDNSMAIIFSGKHCTRSHDSEYPFRQRNHYWYLTNHLEASGILVLQKIKGQESSHLFVAAKNPEVELWSGKRLGQEKARTQLLIDYTYSHEDFSSTFKQLAHGTEHLYVQFDDQENFAKILTFYHELRQTRKRDFNFFANLTDLSPIIEELRSIKSPEEIEILEKGMQVTALAHRGAMALTKPGLQEFQIAAWLDFVFRYLGGSGPAYESIVAAGNNANTLHYISNNDVLCDGQMLLIDSGGEYQGYANDITRSFPVGKKFSPAQREIYQLVLNSQKAVLEKLKLGMTFEQLENIASQALIEGLLDLKILKGSKPELLASKAHKKYYPHSIGHFMGMDVHDQNPYIGKDLSPISMAAGMVITVEPGLYIPLDDESVPLAFRGIGIRIEDDVLLKKDGHDILSKNIPKEIPELEAAMKIPFEECQKRLFEHNLLF